MIDDIGKQAVTIHMYIDEVQGAWRDRHAVSSVRVKGVQKVVNKFLRNMKNSEYYYLSEERWGESFYELIERHLDSKRDHDTAEYLTWIQYQFHRFIKQVFPEYYDGCFRVKEGKFYKRTLEKLLR